MKEIEFNNIQDVISEIINNLGLTLSDTKQLHILKAINIELLIDQLNEDRKMGTIVTKAYIMECLIKTLESIESVD